jgi:hypothetical protein
MTPERVARFRRELETARRCNVSEDRIAEVVRRLAPYGEVPVSVLRSQLAECMAQPVFDGLDDGEPCPVVRLAVPLGDGERDARGRRIAAMWAQGWTTSEIASEVDLTFNSLRTEMQYLRGRGFDLPLRRPSRRAA